jgi:uncharacterized protein YkwD
MLAAAAGAAVVVLAIPATGAGAVEGTASERAEADMIAAINDAREKHRLHALRRSNSLARSAGRFSQRLVKSDSFGHLDTIQASARFQAVGEALAMHRGRMDDVDGTLTRWLGSPSHRALVLSPTMQWAGAGLSRGRSGSTPTTIWVLHLGRLEPPV